MAVGTADAGEPAARVAAVEVSFNDFFDDGPEEAVLLLIAALIFRQELVEVMKKRPAKDSLLRMREAIHSRHGGRMASRNGPGPRNGPRLSGRRGEAPSRGVSSG
jgi:hypothetical protein